jgi:putative inorganic carbon (hco3(-)) transporter
MNRLRQVAARIAAFEPAAVALAAPLLLFPGLRPAWTAVALAALVGVWLAGWMGSGRPWVRTPLDGALLLLAVTIPVGVWASAFPDLTLPKLTGLILGLATYQATVNAARSPRHLGTASAVFLALGFGLVLAGLVGANWFAKWPALEPIVSRLPRLLEGLPGAEEGIHLNELAGALVLFFPVSLALLAGRGLGWGGAAVAPRLAALGVALTSGAMIFFSQSRSAWLGALAAVGVMAWLHWPRQRWLLLTGMFLAVAGLLYVGPLEVLQSVFAPADPVEANWIVDSATLEGRLVLWGQAMQAIQDFPLSGCGLGAFRQVVNVLYPFSSPTFDTDVAHAHNAFLQVALDLGLPGLVAYLALVGSALWIGWRVAQAPGGPFRWLGVGLVGSLVAFHIYGLTDTVALGAKPGVALWMLLGLAAALWVETVERPPGTAKAR